MKKTNHSHSNNGSNLDYIKCTPDNFDSSQPTDIIYALHGVGGSAENFSQVSNICPESASSNSIIIIPSAKNKVWAEESIDLLKSLNEQISQDYNVQNTHLIGHSQGGTTALKLFCDNDVSVDNVFAVSTSYDYEDCNPKNNPNIYLYHYRGDAIVPIDGGQSALPTVGSVVSQEELAKNAAINNGCMLSSKQIEQEGYRTTTLYSDCTGNSHVQHIEDLPSNLRPHSWQDRQSGAILDIIENYSPSTISPSSFAPSPSQYKPTATPQTSEAFSSPNMAFISAMALGTTLAFTIGSFSNSKNEKKPKKHTEKLENTANKSKNGERQL